MSHSLASGHSEQSEGSAFFLSSPTRSGIQGFCLSSCRVSPPHDEVPSTGSGQTLLFRQKDPKPLAPGRGPKGVPLPQSRLFGLPSTSRCRATLRMNGLSLPVHASHPFVLSVAERSRRALRQSSPPNRIFGTEAQPRPKAPGCGAVYQVVIPRVARYLVVT